MTYPMLKKGKGLTFSSVLFSIFFGPLSLSVSAQYLPLEGRISTLFPFKHEVFFDGTTLLSSAQFNPDILPQSPEAEAMTKYTLLPVNLSSGLPQISIPIYDLKTPGLDIPVSLSYNSSGFKPAEVASDVGQGWSVQGGGCVIRHVKSRVDHMDPNTTGNDYDNYTNINYLSGSQAFLQTMGLGEADGEPDLYVFTAPGLSGKFIMLQGQAYMFPYQQIQIKTLGQNDGFLITNEKGDQYIFNQAEQSHHKQTTAFGEYIPDHASAWFLSMIVSADLADTINYAYTQYTYTQPPNVSDILTVTYNSTTSALSTSYNEISSNGDYIQALELSSISSKNATVLFGLGSTPRTDVLIESDSMYPLSQVTIVGSSSVLNETFKLYQNYVAGKLTLTEVDKTSFPTDSDSSVDSLTQKYFFQYTSPDTNVYTVPGWNNKSIDYYGYYNGVSYNTTLFTPTDVPNGVPGISSYSGSNRTPNFAYAVHNTLSKIIYPTGGYDTLIYGPNQQGSYYVTTEPAVTDTVNHVLNYQGNTNTGPQTYNIPFTLFAAQMVHLYYWETGDATSGDPMAVIDSFGVGGRQVYAPPSNVFTNGGASDSVYLLPGVYTMTITCDYSYTAITSQIIYVTDPQVTTNTLSPGPGICIKQVSSYDGIHSSSVLNKYYSYNGGIVAGTTIGAKSSSITQRGDLCSPTRIGSCPTEPPANNTILTLQASINPSVSDLINDQFYYTNAEEIDVASGTNGKTDYVYNSYVTQGDPSVFLVQKTDYAFAGNPYNLGNSYVPLKKAVSNYTFIPQLTFQTFTSTVVQQVMPTTGGCFECQMVPTPDPTQPVTGLTNVYGATHNTIPMGYKSLQSTVDSTWDQNGQNPISQVTDYYYDNPSHIFPTRIITYNSKGQQVTTQLKYSLDYPVLNALTRAGITTDFYNGLNYCDSIYNSQYDNMIIALQPYQPYANYETQFQNVLNSYNCQGNFATNSQSSFNTVNTLWSNYISSLDSAEVADDEYWHDGVYWMQANNIFSPVIEKYVSILKSTGSDSLVSATRNDYSLLTNANGQKVAKQTGIEETELTAPMLKTGFLNNPDSSYHGELTITYDNKMKMISQAKANDVNHCYLWGYNHQFVVAEVVGSTPSTVAGFVNQSVLDNISTNQVTMQNQLNQIRTGLAGTRALVTTATYDPLVGITSKTDPAGRTTYFDYDVLGRLIDIKDQYGNVVKTFQYHYTGQ
jgi:YD repeat-containing protein